MKFTSIAVAALLAGVASADVSAGEQIARGSSYGSTAAFPPARRAPVRADAGVIRVFARVEAAEAWRAARAARTLSRAMLFHAARGAAAPRVGLHAAARPRRAPPKSGRLRRGRREG